MSTMFDDIRTAQPRRTDTSGPSVDDLRQILMRLSFLRGRCASFCTWIPDFMGSAELIREIGKHLDNLADGVVSYEEMTSSFRAGIFNEEVIRDQPG